MHETMHFKGILKNPNTPKLILIQKQRDDTQHRDEYNLDRFHDMLSKPAFHQDFMNKIAADRTQRRNNFLYNSMIISPKAVDF